VLRPGGWALVVSVDTAGDALDAAVERLRCTLLGGAPLADEALGAMLGRAGFTDIRASAELPMPMAPTQARKPAVSELRSPSTGSTPASHTAANVR
jgi:hypothetical protein